MVRSVDGVEVPKVILNVWRIGSRRTHNAAVDAEGRFRLRGLNEGEYRLDFGGLLWSRAVVEPVLAGSQGVDVPMKRTSDLRDHGLHVGEIHGRLLDGESGAALSFEPYHLEEVFVPEGEDFAGFDLQKDVLPNWIWSRPYQTASQMLPPPPTSEFHVTGLDPGRYVVVIRRERGRVAFSQPLTIQGTEMLRNVELREVGSAPMEGVVRDADGRQVEGAVVVFTGVGPYSDARVKSLDGQVVEAGAADRPMFRGTVRSRRDGRFVTPGLPKGVVWRLVALHRDWEPAWGEDLRFVKRRQK